MCKRDTKITDCLLLYYIIHVLYIKLVEKVCIIQLSTSADLQVWQKHFFVLVSSGKLMFTEQQEKEEVEAEREDEQEVCTYVYM